MHDMIYQTDIFRMMGFVNKTCLNWEVYRNRQERYLSLLNRQEQEGASVNFESDALVERAHQNQFFRVVKSKTEVRFSHQVYDIITKSFYRRDNWRELPHGLNLGSTWNLLWTWGKICVDYKKLLVFQKVNHFLNIKRRQDLNRHITQG